MRARPERSRAPVALAEHSGEHLPASLLTERDLERLDRLARRGVLSWRHTPAGYAVEADSHVGVLLLDRIRLRLDPKMHITGAQIITWLRYTQDVSGHRPVETRDWLTSPRGLPDLVVAALIDECRQLVRSGLRRDYVAEDRLEPILRGRLDLRRQIAHRYGMVDQLHIRVHQRQVDVWENHVCHAALRAGVRLARDRDVARAAADLADAFPAHPHGRPHAVQALHRASYHHMNALYRPAHAWADLLFRSGGPADLLEEADLMAGSLLIDMNRLWEAVVRRAVTEAIMDLGGGPEPVGGGSTLRVTVDGTASRMLRPDVLVRYPTEPVAVIPIDAKYKHPTGQAISSDDLHQLLTYAMAYPMPEPPRAMVIHPVDGMWTRHWVRVSGPSGLLGEVLIVGADLRQPAHEYRMELRKYLHGLHGRT